MPKYMELTELDCGKVLGLHLAGDSMSEISKKLKISKGTVYNTTNHYKNCDSVKSVPQSGRPKTLNKDDQKALKEIANQNNHNSLDQIPLEKLIESMPRRIEACISNNGWPTGY